MSGRKEDEEKFHEVDEERFDDKENRYFHFNDDDYYDDDAEEPDDESFDDFSLMVGSIFESLLSLMPNDMQEYANNAFDAILTAGSGLPEESNKILKRLRKHSKGKLSPGIPLMESRNYKAMAVAAMDDQKDDILKNIKHEKKALDEFVRLYESDADTSSVSFDDYLNARSERCRVKNLLHCRKGALSAMIVIPDDREFSMEEILEALSAYYDGTDDDEYAELSYSFLSEHENCICIQYNDPVDFSRIMAMAPEYMHEPLPDDPYCNNPSISVIIDAGKDLLSAAWDLEQVIAAICGLYSGIEYMEINDFPVNPALIPLIVKEASDGIFCDPVLYGYSLSSDRKFFRTHGMDVFGCHDIGICIENRKYSDDNLLHWMSSASDMMMRHKVKPGEEITICGVVFSAETYKDGDNDMIVLRESDNE